MNYLGLNKKSTAKVAVELNNLLANYHIYYQNLRNFHWNITGKNFFELHEQFENLYNDARLKIDKIAERVLTLRYKPLSQLRQYLQIAEIAEADGIKTDAQMVMTILENHRILIENMRRILSDAAEANDEGTIDMIAGFLENLEKQSWILDAWSVKEPAITKVF